MSSNCSYHERIPLCMGPKIQSQSSELDIFGSVILGPSSKRPRGFRSRAYGTRRGASYWGIGRHELRQQHPIDNYEDIYSYETLRTLKIKKGRPPRRLPLSRFEWPAKPRPESRPPQSSVDRRRRTASCCRVSFLIPLSRQGREILDHDPSRQKVHAEHHAEHVAAAALAQRLQDPRSARRLPLQLLRAVVTH